MNPLPVETAVVTETPERSTDIPVCGVGGLGGNGSLGQNQRLAIRASVVGTSVPASPSAAKRSVPNITRSVIISPFVPSCLRVKGNNDASRGLSNASLGLARTLVPTRSRSLRCGLCTRPPSATTLQLPQTGMSVLLYVADTPVFPCVDAVPPHGGAVPPNVDVVPPCVDAVPLHGNAVPPNGSVGLPNGKNAFPRRSFLSPTRPFLPPKPSFSLSRLPFSCARQPLSGSNQSLTGSSQPLFGSSQALFGSSQPLFGSSQALSGASQPLFGTTPPFPLKGRKGHKGLKGLSRRRDLHLSLMSFMSFMSLSSLSSLPRISSFSKRVHARRSIPNLKSKI